MAKLEPSHDANLRTRALELPAADRLALATELMDSVEGIDPEWEEAWAREIDRRVAEVDAGSAKLVPWSDVRAEIDGLLGRAKP
jgi:putative addiction module component (TIGR02574 family)